MEAGAQPWPFIWPARNTRSRFGGRLRKILPKAQKSRENKKFLPGIKIPSQVRLTSDIDEAISFGDLIVLSVSFRIFNGHVK